MACVGPDHVSEYTCRSENRITGRSMADSVTLGGAVARSTKSHIHKLQYIQLLHLGQHEPGLLVRPEMRRG